MAKKTVEVKIEYHPVRVEMDVEEHETISDIESKAIDMAIAKMEESKAYQIGLWAYSKAKVRFV